ncbi:glycoside hydrolase, family 43 [Diaporthe sp. PMI_573]|nr:glycoside hydrolase, family 43 [Diaporthaceae sp. PMI_573]
MLSVSSLTRGLVALALFALPGVQAAYPNPGACSGDCFAHDPALIKRSSDGKYFRFNTGGKIMIYDSDSLSGPWTFRGAAIPGGSSINLAGKDDLWAPDVRLVGDTYYLYYAVSAFGSQASAIGVATSKTLEAGSWTDRGATGVSSKAGSNYNAIDPNLVETADGKFVLNFGSFWNDLYQVPMASNPTKASGSSYNIAFNSSGTHAEEGPFMYYRAPYYYLFWSSGICCGYETTMPGPGEEYRINVCRSESVNGPFVDQRGVSCAQGGGTTVLASHGKVYGPGGQGVLVDASQGGAVLYYHYADTGVGYADADYRFGWNGLSWSTGWPVAK